MKRLLQISLDTLLVSVLPIITWLLLGFIVSKDISNVFSLTYPLQFFYMLFVYVFAIGPNITKNKLKKEFVVDSNILFGIIFVGILTLILLLNINSYIKFMNVDPNIYNAYCLYSVCWMFISFIVQSVTQKLYYLQKNKEANNMNLTLNLINFIFIILLSSIIEQSIAICITLFIDFIFVIYYFIEYPLKLKNIQFCFIENIKYTSFSILKNISMLLIYGFGFSKSFSYGIEYTKAINFEGLTTDAQWDVLSSVETAAKIDVSKNDFNYRKSLKNAYKLLLVLIPSILLMNFTLYWYYKPDLSILWIILLVQIIDMLVNPIASIKLNYLQINSNDKSNNLFYLISRIGRIFCSFIPSAFCTYIGQLFSMVYLYILSKIKCRKIKDFS